MSRAAEVSQAAWFTPVRYVPSSRVQKTEDQPQAEATVKPSLSGCHLVIFSYVAIQLNDQASTVKRQRQEVGKCPVKFCVANYEREMTR